MLAVAVVLAAVYVGRADVRRVTALQRGVDRTRWLVEVGRAIGADAGGPCSVVTTLPPMIGWYSGCNALPFTHRPPTVAGQIDPTDPSLGVAYVMFSAVDGQRASPALIAAQRAKVGARAVAISLPPSAARYQVEVYRLSR